MAEPRRIGEALDLVDNIGRRSLKEWRPLGSPHAGNEARLER
jgi:hypothetical protein